MKPNESPPQAQLMNFIVGKWISKPIYAAAKLGIADICAQGPKSIEEIIIKTPFCKFNLQATLLFCLKLILYKTPPCMYSVSGARCPENLLHFNRWNLSDRKRRKIK